MSRRTVSSQFIAFMEPEHLIAAIVKIEKLLPGWWWSISQRPAELGFSWGPGRNCPDSFDNEYAKTIGGDHGFVQSMYFTSNETGGDFLGWIDDVYRLINFRREAFRKSQHETPPLSQEKYRSQDKTSLGYLLHAYADFLAEVTLIEHKGHILGELYLGSCDLSVDCSIRGKRIDGSEFDVTVDLLNDATLAESFRETFTELKNDILTPIST